MRLKDQEFILAKIKITKVREHYKDGLVHSFKDKLLCVDIDNGNTTVLTSFPDNLKGNKDLLKFIAKELYLKGRKNANK